VPTPEVDAIVVGAGPNGLAAAREIARAGHSVLVVEGAETPGGGTRTKELTLPGFHHDVCSAIHPTGATSPVFADLDVEWVQPDIAMVNPFDDGSASELHRTVDDTVAANGEGDRWARLLGPLVERWPAIADTIMGPPVLGPRHPVNLLRFGLRALPPASTMAKALGPKAGALFLGTAAHANTSMSAPLSSAAGLALAAAGHAGGWPLAKGGSQAIADALVRDIEASGGTIECGRPVANVDELPRARVVLFDTSPWQLLEIAGHRLPATRRWRYRRFRKGNGSFKVDYALDGPMPWTNDAARRAGTVHVGGSVAELLQSEHDVSHGRVPEQPFVLTTQQSLFDDTRAPEGKHTLWAYCHTPNASTVDMTDRIERQLDRFAPGWRDLVLGRHVTSPMGLEAYNPNYVGGDIAAGAPDLLQVLFRPVIAVDPYKTGAEGIYVCSASTPPGGGVHGLCGWWAAKSALKQLAR
jgi:phytoene dehydrogenase-like protein